MSSKGFTTDPSATTATTTWQPGAGRKIDDLGAQQVAKELEAGCRWSPASIAAWVGAGGTDQRLQRSGLRAGGCDPNGAVSPARAFPRVRRRHDSPPSSLTAGSDAPECSTDHTPTTLSEHDPGSNLHPVGPRMPKRCHHGERIELSRGDAG